MKRLAPLVALFLVLALGAAPLLRAATAADTPVESVPDKSPAAPYATAIATLTGVAISPLLGTAGLGVWQNWRAKTQAQKDALPWFAKWTFILPALLVVGVCAAKDAFGAVVPPGLKKPLDVLETIENKASGLVAAGAVVPFTMGALSDMIVGSSSAASGDVLLHSGAASVVVGAIDWSWALNILTIPLGLAAFGVVWLAGHAINALILLSPWGAIDAALKGARTALLGLVVGVSALDPWAGLALSLVVILMAWLIAGWSFRLTVFGAIFCWDFLTFRKKRFAVARGGENRMFSSNALTKRGVPMRTYGRLKSEPENGRWMFRYRPWLVLAEKSAEVRLDAPSVGAGLFISSIQDGDKTAFVLPPRYRDHETELAAAYGIEGGVRPAGLLKAWGALRELFGGGAARAQITG